MTPPVRRNGGAKKGRSSALFLAFPRRALTMSGSIFSRAFGPLCPREAPNTQVRLTAFLIPTIAQRTRVEARRVQAAYKIRVLRCHPGKLEVLLFPSGRLRPRTGSCRMRFFDRAQPTFVDIVRLGVQTSRLLTFGELLYVQLPESISELISGIRGTCPFFHRHPAE